MKLKEIWKPIENYEGLYKISNLGRVKSLRRKGKRKNTIMDGGFDNYGYRHITLCKNGKGKTRKISLLVWDTFGEGKRNGYKLQVDHIDGNRRKDWIINLQLLTCRQNTIKGHIQNGKKISKYIGVCWHKKNKKWMTQIYINGKRKNLGYFKNEYNAHLKYKEALNLYINQKDK